MTFKQLTLHGASLRTRTHVQSGNAASDKCYAGRNYLSIGCASKGWPQDKNADPFNLASKGWPQDKNADPFNLGNNPCWGNANEIRLMRCLNQSGETRWWQDFAGCTSAEQCLSQAKQTHKTLTGED